jgi:drug/metabolite transporter (DMT)-like permease
MASALDHVARRREREGVALCVVTAASFAALVVFAKLAHAAGASISSVLAPRFAIASAVLGLLAARRGVAGVTPRDALAALLLGMVLYAGETLLMFKALARIDASLVELLAFTYPAFVVLGAIALRREAPSRRRLAALALASGGVVLVLAGSMRSTPHPALLVLPLGSALGYATYVLMAQRLGERIHPLTFASLVCCGAAIAFGAGGAANGSLDLAMGPTAWFWTLAITLGATVVPMSAFLAGVARLGSGRASILAMLEPPLAIVACALVFGERLGPEQLAGGTLVLAAAVTLQLRSVRSRDHGAAALSASRTAARALAR